MLLESSDGVLVPLHELGGDPDAPPLLICHASGFLAAPYRPMARHIGEIRRIVGIDMRGHGDSVVPDGVTMNWRGMIADVTAAIEHLGADHVDAVGHSMGGAAIVGAALSGASVGSAWLFEPILFPDRGNGPGPHPNPMADAARRRRPEFESHDAVYERYASRPPLSIFDREVLRLYADEGFRPSEQGVRLKCEPDTEASVFEHSQVGLFERLGDLELRVHVEAGELDEGPPMIAPMVAEEIAGASFHRDDAITHFGPFQDPAVIGARIRAWLGE